MYARLSLNNGHLAPTPNSCLTGMTSSWQWGSKMNPHHSSFERVETVWTIDRLRLSWAITVFSLGPGPRPRPRPADPEMIIQNSSDSSSELYWFQPVCIWASTDLSVMKTSGKIQARLLTISKSRSRCQTPVRNLQRPPKPQMRT